MKKNVLVIICDQLRKDTLGCYGNKNISTPNIDDLFKDSVMYTRNYVANPICMPNRHTLFSGMYPHNHGVWTNGILTKDEDYNLMYHLKDNGYNTASIGKIHFEPNGGDVSNGSKECDAWYKTDEGQNFHGPYRGFDYIELVNQHHGIGGHMIPWFYANGGTDEMFDTKENDCYDVPKNLHSTAFVGERTSAYIRSKEKDKPFFLVASFPDPHHPYSSPTECYNKIKDKEYSTPIGTADDLTTRPARYTQLLNGEWSRGKISAPSHLGGLSKEDGEKRIRHTYAMVELIDEYIGKIMNTLIEENLLDDTIIIFTADHGELLGDHGLWTKGPFFYEGLVSTPLAIKTPRATPRICEDLISAVDFAPTICDLLGVDIPYYMDGISQKSTLVADTNLRNNCMIEYRNGYEKKDINYKVVLDKQYKYVLAQNGEQELNDMKNDPCEKTNLAGDKQYDEVIMQYKESLLLEMLKSESKKPLQYTHA